MKFIWDKVLLHPNDLFFFLALPSPFLLPTEVRKENRRPPDKAQERVCEAGMNHTGPATKARGSRGLFRVIDGMGSFARADNAVYEIKRERKQEIESREIYSVKDSRKKGDGKRLKLVHVSLSLVKMQEDDYVWERVGGINTVWYSTCICKTVSFFENLRGWNEGTLVGNWQEIMYYMNMYDMNCSTS